MRPLGWPTATRDDARRLLRPRPPAPRTPRGLQSTPPPVMSPPMHNTNHHRPGGGSPDGRGRSLGGHRPPVTQARRAARLPLIALLLAALVAAILAASSPVAAQTVPNGSEEVWSSTMTAQSLATSGYSGCDQVAATSCARHLTDRTFRIGGTTYTVRGVVSAGAQLVLTTTPRLPSRFTGWIIVFKGNVQQGTTTHTLTRRQGGDAFVGSGIPGWSSGQSVEITLYRPYADIEAEDKLKAATRSATACPGAVDHGPLWHCHGDAVYHAHGPDWRYRHPAPSQTVRPTADPDPVPRPPATEPASAAAKAKGFGDWHSHPDGVFHSHGSGVHPHRVTTPIRDFYHWHGEPPTGTYHAHPRSDHPH